MGEREEETRKSLEETEAMVSDLEQKVREQEEAIESLVPDVERLETSLHLKKTARDKVMAMWMQLQEVNAVLDPESAHVLEEAQSKLRALNAGMTPIQREVSANKEKLSRLKRRLREEAASVQKRRAACAEERAVLEKQLEAERAEAEWAEECLLRARSERASRQQRQQQLSLGLASSRGQADRRLDEQVRASGLLSDIAAIHGLDEIR